jgi:hypothetical protein
MRSTLKQSTDYFGYHSARSYVFYLLGGERRVRSFSGGWLQEALEFCASLWNNRSYQIIEIVDAGGTAHSKQEVVDYLTIHHPDLLRHRQPIKYEPIVVYETHRDQRWLSDDPMVDRFSSRT